MMTSFCLVKKCVFLNFFDCHQCYTVNGACHPSNVGHITFCSNWTAGSKCHKWVEVPRKGPLSTSNLILHW